MVCTRCFVHIHGSVAKSCTTLLQFIAIGDSYAWKGRSCIGGGGVAVSCVKSDVKYLRIKNVCFHSSVIMHFAVMFK